MIIRIFFWLIILFILNREGNAMNQYEFLGEVTDVARESHGVLLTCGPHQLRIQFLTDAIVRITLARNGKWPRGPEYAVARHDWPGARIQFREDEQTIELQSDLLRIRITRKPCRLAFYNAGDDLLNQDDPAFGMAWDGDEVAVFKTLLQGEQFFGLGEKVGPLNKRGREWVMWNSDTPAYTDRTDPLYQSHPFFIGFRNGLAYGIFFNNTYKSYFNLGGGSHRLYSFRAEKGHLDYFFFAGPGMKDILRQYGEVVGKMPMPPLWALGYQQCRWSYFPESEVRRIAQTFRDKRIPADVIYLDIHYMDGYRCFTFDPQRFPDPARMLADLRKMGFKVVTIVDPGIKIDPDYHVYRSGVEGGHFITYPDGERYSADVWPGPSHFANFTRPQTRKWWGDLHKEFIEMGIAGFWNDMNEPSVWGKETPPLVEFEEEGQAVSIKKIHNVFAHLMAQATYEGWHRVRPKDRAFILTRAGFSGTQRYAASWTGDNRSTFLDLDIAVRMCLNMGLTGIPFVGADVGGFAGSSFTELFVRWIQVGAFTPLFRTHTEVNSEAQEPWSFGEWAEEVVRRYIELRYRLLPYTYTAFYQAASEALPIMRPLFLEYPDDSETFAATNQTTYLWGDHLLVAPVTAAGQTVRKVYLPKGIWYDFWTDRPFEGGGYVYVDAPLETLPLFVRAGAVLPMREVQQYVDEKPLTALELHVYPGEGGRSFLYEDDGSSMAYTRGEWRITRFAVEHTEEAIRLNLGDPEGAYQPHRRDWVIILHGQKQEPLQVLVDGKALAKKDIAFDPESSTVRIVMTDDNRSHTIQWLVHR